MPTDTRDNLPYSATHVSVNLVLEEGADLLIIHTLLFVGGTILVTRLESLPGLGALSAGGVLWILVVARFQLLRVSLPLLAGFLFAVVHSESKIASRIPAHLEGHDLELAGTIASLPSRPTANSRAIRFRFRVDGGVGAWPDQDTTIDLVYYGSRGSEPVEFQPGEVWKIVVRLNRPHGSVNPGLFDYEGWLLAEGVAARGYIRASDSPPTRLEPSGIRFLHHQFRYWLRERLDETLAGSRYAGLVTALVIGESREISSVDWQTLSNTGTNHLLIVSGLHVGLVAAASFRLSRLVLSKGASLGISLAVAFVYGCIAGLGLPVQRALAMTTVALISVLSVRNISLGTMFCAALLLVTLTDPLASLRAGFWLSFGAVFSLIFAFCGRSLVVASDKVLIKTGHWLLASLRTQWSVFVGTLPILLAVTHQLSLVSFVANLIAIPVVSLTVIPLLLLSVPLYVVSDNAGSLSIEAALFFLSRLWSVLEAFSASRLVYHAQPVLVLQLAIAMTGVYLILTPRGFLPRWLGLLLLVPLFTSSGEEMQTGDFMLKVLDVGQGLSVQIKTARHSVLYDAGPKFGSGFDAGAQIVVPSLRLAGDKHRLDHLVLSHGDNDHAGGIDAVRDNLLVMKFYDQDGSFEDSCHETKEFELDGVSFSFLSVAGLIEGNDLSCVLLIRSEEFSALLPGDLEEKGEHYLVERGIPEIDVMVAPHHGSLSSSSPAFLNEIRVDHVIFSSGYNNRFGHPDPIVVQRYLSRHVSVYNTATAGAVTVNFRAGKPVLITTARSTHRRFWYD